jgi:hypothetical protein
VGSIIPIATTLVWTTGTSATVMGLYAAGYKGTPAASATVVPLP